MKLTAKSLVQQDDVRRPMEMVNDLSQESGRNRHVEIKPEREKTGETLMKTQ